MSITYSIVSFQPTGRYFLCGDGVLRDFIFIGFGKSDTLIWKRKAYARKKLQWLRRVRKQSQEDSHILMLINKSDGTAVEQIVT